MPLPIVFNSSNIVNNGFNNTLSLTLGGSALILKDMELSLQTLSQYNSVFNITSQLGNNSFTILLPYGITGVPTWYNLSITLPNGYYAYSDLNNYIQNQLISLGFYLINSNNQYVYPIQIVANSNRYACEIDLFKSNTTLPTGWSYANSGYWSSSAGMPPAGYCPQIVIPSTSLQQILGFTAGTYPSSTSTSNVSFLSSFTPEIAPVQSYLLRCSLVSNKYSIISDLLYSYNTAGTSIGQLITVNPNEFSWVPINDQSVSTITLTITDPFGNPVQFQDPNILITLLLRPKKKYSI